MDNYQQLLKDYWGYDAFRGIQHDIIQSIGSGHDTLGLMPTGGGKSITFQVPALAAEGVCIVITPLIALMKDQVEHLRQRGIKAAAIYMGMTHEKVLVTLDNAVFGAYKMLYVSPERLSSELFQTKLSHMHVSFICVDEAHCISQWGYDFRPSYLQIAQIRDIVPTAPVLALTATATPNVVKDIQQQLHFKEERVFRMSFERKNLAYKVHRTDNKEKDLRRLLTTRQGSVIIYCRNRQHCKELAELIQTWDETATYYHAGLTNAEKDERQHKWQKGTIRIMVATNAFGMGIDKPDVRLVVHIDMPDAIESYFQEAGRAGRDGEYAEAILLYDKSNLTTLRKRVAEVYPDKQFIRDVYEEVCCYLHIAMGFGMGIRREFNIEEFCRNFHHFPVPIENALKLLTKAGYINYTDADDGISRVMFTLNRDDLYRIHSQEAKKDAIMRVLLRNYSGLFINYINIDESYIAKETGLTDIEVYHELRELTRQNILNYIPKKTIPHISFTIERREKSRLVFPKEIYEERRNCLKDRIESMIEYASEDDTCRNRYLLSYFGEKTKTDCHQCDICLENEQDITNIIEKEEESNAQTCQEKKEQTKQDLIQQIAEAGSIHPFNLITDHLNQDLVKEVIAEMTDNEEIAMDDCLRIYLTK